MVLLLLLKVVGNARLGESDRHPISSKISAPQNVLSCMEKEEKQKILEDKIWISCLVQYNNSFAYSENPLLPHHRILGQQDYSTGTLRGE